MNDLTADYIAWYCGDTFIGSDKDSPVDQWNVILSILRENGFEVIEKIEEENN